MYSEGGSHSGGNDTDIVVNLDKIGKCYRVFKRPSERLKNILFSRYGKSWGSEFWALKNISLKISKGQTLGIIGRNGSGKSTLLQIIAGTSVPTVGTATIQGRISALLELGSGFNPEYSGRENILLNGATLGISKESMLEKLESIIAFADIGPFLDQPVKTYSSGMAMRIAFAVAAHVDPEILIVDEALSVGDARFQQKCLRKIEQLKRTASVILVSHDLSAIRSFCDRAIWINDGEVRSDGSANDICREYLSESHARTSEISNNSTSSVNEPMINLAMISEKFISTGSGEIKVVACGFIDESNKLLEFPCAGTHVRYGLRCRVMKSLEDRIIVGLTIRNRLGEPVLSLNSLWAEGGPMFSCPEVGKDAVWIFRFRLPELNAGAYTVSPAVAFGSQSEHVVVNWVNDATIFSIGKHESDLPGLLVLNEYSVQEFQNNDA
jgi:ABC-type polysaccharide/polyol phosphate transport system ATPase subunit